MKLLKILKTDSWVKPYLKKYRKTLLFAIFLGFLTFGSGAALMFNSGYLISKAASHPANILLIYVPVVLTRAFGVSRPVFRYIERLTSHNWVFKLTSDLRRRLYLSLENGFYSFTNKIRLGDMLGLLSEDIGHLQNLYLRTIFPLFVSILLSVIVVLGLGWFSPFFALAMLILLSIAISIFPLVSVLRLGALQEQQKIQRNVLYTQLTDNVLGVADWMFSGRSEDFIAKHEQAENELRSKVKAMHHFSYLRDFFLELFFGIIVVIVIIWSGQRFQGSNGGAANWVAAFVLCVFPLIDVFAPLSDAVVETNIYADSIKRLNDLPEETKDSKMIVTETDKTLPTNVALLISDLHFAYDSDEILKGVNLQISSGQKVAILGKSGSGKSTLAKLIYGGLIASSGMVSINGQSSMSDTSRLIGVIHQNPYLFNTSLRNNLRLGNENATDVQLWDVLKAVGLNDMVRQLPNALDTMVDEAGLRFSGGERHRLALARILLKNTPIVVLDEATVGLDPITENQVLLRTFDLLKDKTVLFITHHLLGVDHMDRVVFLENGKIELDNSPQELSRTNRHYQQLLLLDQGWI